MEKLLCSRLLKFFKKHFIISHNQYGFQKQLSTVHTVLDVVNNCCNSVNEGNYTGLVLWNFKKAFDTVCHGILLQKVEHYGVRGLTNQLLASFLENRKHIVSHLNDKSQTLTVPFGVSQGSNLGPLLFLIYINDLSFAIDCTTKLYADDSCLLVNAPYPYQLETIINNN